MPEVLIIKRQDVLIVMDQFSINIEGSAMTANSVNTAYRQDVELDLIDLRIIDQLQRSGRLTNVELANRVHLSPSPCLARVRALEESGVLKRYVALADAESLGLKVTVFIHVTLDKQAECSLEVFEQAVRQRPEVLECYLMTGDQDYILRVAVADVSALQEFIVHEIARIPCVSNIRSSFALKQVKYETALPLGICTAMVTAKRNRSARVRVE